MYNFISDDSDITRPVFRVEIDSGTKSAFANGPNVFVLAEVLDSTCMKLSKLIPGASVKVECLSRIKCTYKDGVRSEVRDMKMFYNNLTEEQYKATQFLCNKKHEMV